MTGEIQQTLSDHLRREISRRLSMRTIFNPRRTNQEWKSPSNTD